MRVIFLEVLKGYGIKRRFIISGGCGVKGGFYLCFKMVEVGLCFFIDRKE